MLLYIEYHRIVDTNTFLDLLKLGIFSLKDELRLHAETRVKMQGDRIILNTNLAAPRPCEIWR